MATAAIPFDGKTLNLYGVQKYFEHEDREVRKAAVKAYSDFYHGNEKRLEEIRLFCIPTAAYPSGKW